MAPNATKSKTSEETKGEVQPEPAPEHTWKIWEKRPSTVKVREAIPGEEIDGKAAKKGDFVVKREDGKAALATSKALIAEYITPPPEAEPKSKWKIDYYDHDIVPFEFRNKAGIPDRRLIMALFEKSRLDREDVKAWNKSNPDEKRKVMPYPTVLGVRVSYRQDV